MEKYDIEIKVVEMLKTVFDPEIPVNVWDLGMIYKIDVVEVQNDQTTNLPEDQLFDVNIDMTFTAPNCPAADFILEDINQKVTSIEGVKSVDVAVVFEPEWTKEMMSEEAKLDLGFL